MRNCAAKSDVRRQQKLRCRLPRKFVFSKSLGIRSR